VGAVRFGEDASIGVGFWTTAHGGAMETVLDEATAEVCKISQAASAVTIEVREADGTRCLRTTRRGIMHQIVSYTV
jgi:hypothetical protein